jgi:hypothetical protein
VKRGRHKSTASGSNSLAPLIRFPERYGWSAEERISHGLCDSRLPRSRELRGARR